MSDPCWHDVTKKDMVPPFTYYWVNNLSSRKIHKIVVIGLRPSGDDEWTTTTAAGGIDFDLAVQDGRVVIPFSGHNDRIFNNWWAAYAHMLKLKAGDATK